METVVAQEEFLNKVFDRIQTNINDKLLGFIFDGPSGIGKTHIGGGTRQMFWTALQMHWISGHYG